MLREQGIALSKILLVIVHASAVMTAHFQHTGSLMELEGGWRTPSVGYAEAGVSRVTVCCDRQTRRGLSAALGRPPSEVAGNAPF